MMDDRGSPHTLPPDYDARMLLENVHPSTWRNPQPSGKYDLVVVGAGPAGLLAAHKAATQGAKVALIERDLLGGECLKTGCIRSEEHTSELQSPYDLVC